MAKLCTLKSLVYYCLALLPWQTCPAPRTQQERDAAYAKRHELTAGLFLQAIAEEEQHRLLEEIEANRNRIYWMIRLKYEVFDLSVDSLTIQEFSHEYLAFLKTLGPRICALPKNLRAAIKTLIGDLTYDQMFMQNDS